jgi:hypothetical protein
VDSELIIHLFPSPPPPWPCPTSRADLCPDALHQSCSHSPLFLPRRTEILAPTQLACTPPPIQRASLIGTAKLLRPLSLRSANQRRRNNQYRRPRHPRLNRCLPNRFHQRCDTPRRRPHIVVRMSELKIVRPQHQDHQRQRRINLNALADPFQSTATRFERVVPNRPPPVHAIFNHPDLVPRRIQRIFHHAWPALFKRQSFTSTGNNPPAQRIGIHQNLLPIGSAS